MMRGSERYTPVDDQTVRVRSAREGDYADLSRMWRQLDQLHARLHPDYFNVPGQAGHRTLTGLRRVLAAPNRAVLVAVDERDRPVGAVHVHLYETPHDRLLVRARRGHVEDLVVDEQHRRGGIGQLLMEEAAAWCRRHGAKQLVLTVWSGNEGAEEFYRRLGYRPINRVLAVDIG